MPPDPRDAARQQFLRRYASDLEAGTLLDLAGYQALFPGFEAEVAHEFRCVDDEGPVGAGAASVGSAAPSGPAAAAGAPRQFGGYRLVRELGRGGQAIVYLAEDVQLGRQVALKMLRTGALELASAEDVRRFRREAEVSARLDHPHICSIYEAGEAEGLPYIAMRFVPGETLAKHIAACREHDLESRTLRLLPVHRRDHDGTGTKSDVDALLRVFELCARALHFAHEHGLVHRDVKPGNVMITVDGEPVLLDFGLARADGGEHSLTASGVLLGTPYYMAPEQVRGQSSQIDRRTDVYGLGVAMYEALTLQKPFEAASREALYRLILLHEPRPARTVNPRIARDLQVVVDTAMAKEPGRRYQDAAALAEDLRRVRERQPIVARPAGPLLCACRWAQRRPAVAGLLALLVLVVVAGLLALGERNRTLAGKVDELTWHSDLRLLDRLERQCETLPCGDPAAHLPALRAWAGLAREVLDRRAAHEAARDALRAQQQLVGEAAWAGSQDEWQLATLVELLRRLERFAGESHPTGERHLQVLATLEQRSLVDGADAWSAAIAAIADVARHPRYGGLRIVPQLGLLPLGPDPRSGLWEFAALATGEPPVRDASGALHLTPACGTVLVLLPGGTFTMGARPADGEHDRDAPNVDPHCRVRERPPHDVTLAPFFLGKHEITQAQWTRHLGWNPSGGGRDADAPRELLPADSVGRAEAYVQMRRIGLTLPTEAQWEYGARGGTTTVWWTGNDPLALDRAANLLDWSWLQHSKEPVPEGAVELRLDDGFAGPAPIGSFLPNAFGLHDVLGNLMEHVLDCPVGYDVAPQAGDGMRTGTLDLAKVKERGIRGGSFQTGVGAARSAHRDMLDAYSPALGIGFRVARPLVAD